MGFLNDIWNDIQIFFIDITDYSQAEQNKDKYRQTAKELSKKIKKYEEDLDSAKETCQALDQAYTLNDWAAKGDWSTHYTGKRDIWTERKNTIMKAMEMAMETAKERKAEAERLAGYWAEEEKVEESRVRNQVYHKKEEKAERERKEAERRRKR